MSVDNLSQANLLMVQNLRSKESVLASQPHADKGSQGRRGKRKDLSANSGRGSHQSLNQDLQHLPFKPSSEELAEA